MMVHTDGGVSLMVGVLLFLHTGSFTRSSNSAVLCCLVLCCVYVMYGMLCY